MPDNSRWWIDQQINKLRNQGVSLAYGKMDEEDSSFEEDEEMKSNEEKNNKEEFQVSKKRKNAIENPQDARNTWKQVASAESQCKNQEQTLPHQLQVLPQLGS